MPELSPECLEPYIQALITERLLKFHEALVERGQILPLTPNTSADETIADCTVGSSRQSGPVLSSAAKLPYVTPLTMNFSAPTKRNGPLTVGRGALTCWTAWPRSDQGATLWKRSIDKRKHLQRGKTWGRDTPCLNKQRVAYFTRCRRYLASSNPDVRIKEVLVSIGDASFVWTPS